MSRDKKEKKMAQIMNVGLDGISFQTKVTANRLQKEYELMRQLLKNINSQVEGIMFRLSSFIPVQPLQERNEQKAKLHIMECKEISRQLEIILLDLKAIQVDNGREHRYLKGLQQKLTEENNEEKEELESLVSELTRKHKFNSLLKTEIQKKIVQAKEKISKIKSLVSHRNLNIPQNEDFSFLTHSYTCI